MNEKLRIAVPAWDPWNTPCGAGIPALLRMPGRCDYPGFCGEIMGMFLAFMGMVQDRDYELVPMPTVDDWGKPPDNFTDDDQQWSGVLGMLQNGTLDAIGSAGAF